MKVDLDLLRALMKAAEEFDLAELEIEDEEMRIALRRGATPNVAPAPVAFAGAPSAAPGASSSAAPSAKAPDDPSVTYITSPFVGTFYRAANPSAPPFIREGDKVQPGKVLCIVEAMKLMNEIEAEVAGTLLEILVENGKPVEYGEKLFKVRKP
jgi:acetyl-CoA carboxylase biotin carboxyl carrier protein